MNQAHRNAKGQPAQRSSIPPVRRRVFLPFVNAGNMASDIRRRPFTGWKSGDFKRVQREVGNAIERIQNKHRASLDSEGAPMITEKERSANFLLKAFRGNVLASEATFQSYVEFMEARTAMYTAAASIYARLDVSQESQHGEVVNAFRQACKGADIDVKAINFLNFMVEGGQDGGNVGERAYRSVGEKERLIFEQWYYPRAEVLARTAESRAEQNGKLAAAEKEKGELLDKVKELREKIAELEKKNENLGDKNAELLGDNRRLAGRVAEIDANGESIQVSPSMIPKAGGWRNWAIVRMFTSRRERRQRDKWARAAEETAADESGEATRGPQEEQLPAPPFGAQGETAGMDEEDMPTVEEEDVVPLYETPEDLHNGAIMQPVEQPAKSDAQIGKEEKRKRQRKMWGRVWRRTKIGLVAASAVGVAAATYFLHFRPMDDKRMESNRDGARMAALLAKAKKAGPSDREIGRRAREGTGEAPAGSSKTTGRDTEKRIEEFGDPTLDETIGAFCGNRGIDLSEPESVFIDKTIDFSPSESVKSKNMAKFMVYLGAFRKLMEDPGKIKSRTRAIRMGLRVAELSLIVSDEAKHGQGGLERLGHYRIVQEEIAPQLKDRSKVGRKLTEGERSELKKSLDRANGQEKWVTAQKPRKNRLDEEEKKRKNARKAARKARRANRN